MGIVRIGTREDIEEVSKLWYKMAKELHPSELPNTDWWVELAESMIENDMYYLFILEHDEVIIGFLDMFIMRVPLTGKVHVIGMSLYVEPQFRKSTFSGLLYKKAISTAKRIGATVIELICSPTEYRKWHSIGYTVASMTMRKI